MDNRVFNFGNSPLSKRLYSARPSDFPAIGARPPPPQLPQLAPDIINLTDGQPNFRNMKLAELVGEVRDSEIMYGGDLCAHPSSVEQQDAILSSFEIAGSFISCSLPRTVISSTITKGVIHGVPIPDKEEEILVALENQNVVHVKRLPVRGHPEILSETVVLTFSSKIPDRVKIAAMVYRVQQSIPTPFRCRKCWRLGHPTPRCSESSVCCKKCGKSHPIESTCSTKCVNWHSPSHEADSDTCPEFVVSIALCGRLTPGSSIFSEELHGIRKALSLIYATDSPTPEIHLFHRPKRRR